MDAFENAATIFPCLMTRSRSLTSRTSFRSAEIRREAICFSRTCRTRYLRIISAVPTSTPRVGWFARTKFAPDVNSRATTTFWMFPPESSRISSERSSQEISNSLIRASVWAMAFC